MLAVLHLLAPQLQDLPLQLLQIGAGGLLELPLHPGPDIFDWVKVWAVSRPPDESDVGLAKKNLVTI